jgi:hypothetical protein
MEWLYQTALDNFMALHQRVFPAGLQEAAQSSSGHPDAPQAKSVARAHLEPHLDHIRGVFRKISDDNGEDHHIPKVSVAQAFPFRLSADRERALLIMKGGADIRDSDVSLFGRSEDPVLIDAASALKHSMKIYPGDHGPSKVRSLSRQVFERKPLLFRQNPWFAAEDPSLVADAIGAVASLVRDRLRSSPSSAAGAILLGSISKGYFKPLSDLDCAFIGDRDASRKFCRAAKGSHLNLCYELSEPVNHENMTEPRNVSFLFDSCGIFIGDLARFRNLQISALDQIDDSAWGRAVEIIKITQSNNWKEETRHGIGSSLFKKHVNELLRVPPPNLQEAREVAMRNSKRGGFSNGIISANKVQA